MVSKVGSCTVSYYNPTDIKQTSKYGAGFTGIPSKWLEKTDALMLAALKSGKFKVDNFDAGSVVHAWYTDAAKKEHHAYLFAADTGKGYHGRCGDLTPAAQKALGSVPTDATVHMQVVRPSQKEGSTVAMFAKMNKATFNQLNGELKTLSRVAPTLKTYQDKVLEGNKDYLMKQVAIAQEQAAAKNEGGLMATLSSLRIRFKSHMNTLDSRAKNSKLKEAYKKELETHQNSMAAIDRILAPFEVNKSKKGKQAGKKK